MTTPCPACAGTAPTHTCESYSPEAARRGYAMAMHAISAASRGYREWGALSSARCGVYRWQLWTAMVSRDTARTYLRGLLLPQIVEQAREEERRRWRDMAIAAVHRAAQGPGGARVPSCASV